jgi:hypothetical protein
MMLVGYRAGVSFEQAAARGERRGPSRRAIAAARAAADCLADR